MTLGHDPARHAGGPARDLALEGEVTGGALERSLAWVRERVPADGVRRVADPDALLRRVLAATAEGGSLAVVEGTEALQVLGDVEGSRPDLEARVTAAARAAHGIVESGPS